MKQILDTLTYEVTDQIAVMTFTRPDVRNALDITMRNEIAQLVLQIRADKDLRALIITGSGGSFCAGGDLKGLTGEEQPVHVNRERVSLLHRWFIELCNLELPVIAAVDGQAYGAGFNLTLGCDFILATPRTRFCAVFGRIGLVPDLGGLYLLPRIVGLQRAKELVLTARSFCADEARDLGLVLHIHPEEKLLDAAMAMAGRFRAASPVALGQAKQMLNQSFHNDQKAMADMESWAQAVCMASEYHKSAVQQFLDKKPLEFDWDRMTAPKKD